MPAIPIFRRARGAACAAFTLTLLQAGAHAATITVPASLQTPADQKLMLEAHATGVQIYTCVAGAKEGGPPAWTFKAPEAILVDATGAKIATHYAGPTWEALDGSKVIGKMKASATPAPDAIAWLLLDVKSAEGAGMFGKVTAVQRLATEGGKAPDGVCTAGAQVRVPYQAVYRFYTAR